MTDILNFADIAKEQDRISSVLTMDARILKDSCMIKPQRDCVKHNMDVKTQRFNHLTVLAALSCADCKHPRADHASRGKCYVTGCACDEWVVVDES